MAIGRDIETKTTRLPGNTGRLLGVRGQINAASRPGIRSARPAMSGPTKNVLNHLIRSSLHKLFKGDALDLVMDPNHCVIGIWI